MRLGTFESAAGTPPGVGVYRDPPVLLEAGDTVTVGVEGLGEVTNPCAYD